MRPCVALSGLLLLVPTGCRPAAAPEEPAPAASPAADPASDDEALLAELADALDPGPQRPLSADVPPWLADAFGVQERTQDLPALAEMIRKPLTIWQELPSDVGDYARMQALMGIGRGIVLAEKEIERGDDADLEVLVTLERLYSVIDAPFLADDRGIFGSMLQVAIQIAAAEGAEADALQIKQLTDFAMSSLRRAGKLQRRAVAQILRTAPDHPAVPDALSRAAKSVSSEDEQLGLKAMSASLSLRGAKAEPTHFIAFAHLCYEALDVRCGDAAREEAEAVRDRAKGDEELTKAYASLDIAATNARKATDLRSKSDLDSQLELGGVLLALARYDDAAELFEKLAKAHPGDARPVSGLARKYMMSRADVRSAYEVIDAAGMELSNKQPDYFEIAIGTRAMMLFYDVMPRATQVGMEEGLKAAEPILAKLRVDVLAYEKMGSDDAVVLHLILDTADEIIPLVRASKDKEIVGFIRGFLDRATALQISVPNSYQAYSVMLGATMFSPDQKRAVQAARIPVKLERRETEAKVRQARTLLDLAIAWEAYDLLPEVRTLAQALPLEHKTPIIAHLAAIEARLNGSKVRWERAEEAYLAHAPAEPTEAHAGLLNNIGVVNFELGAQAEAITAWERSILLDEDKRTIPTINLAVTRGSPADLAALEKLATDGTDDANALAAQWWVTLAPDARTRRTRARAARVRHNAVREAAWRPGNVMPGKAGVLLEGTANVNISYSTVDGLVLALDVGSEPWLVLIPKGKT